MNILITGLNNYLGEKLASYFAEQGDHVFCLVRSKVLFTKKIASNPNITVVEGDLFREKYALEMPSEIDVAFYLNRELADKGGIHRDMEIISVQNYVKKLRRISCQHFVYMSRMRSPLAEEVAQLLRQSYIPYTVVRTSNIIGKGSLLMDIMGRIASKFFIVSTSQIAKSQCQPIALADVLCYLRLMMLNPEVFNKKFDMGGPDSLSYKEMIQRYLEVCKLKRSIITLPGMGLLADLWLSFSAGISLSVARTFNYNASYDLLCEDEALKELFPHDSLRFDEAVRLALA